jgi:hypothetical protein
MSRDFQKALEKASASELNDALPHAKGKGRELIASKIAAYGQGELQEAEIVTKEHVPSMPIPKDALEPFEKIAEGYMMECIFRAAAKGLKSMDRGWNMLTESAQSAILTGLENAIEKAVRKARVTLVSRSRPAVVAKVDSVSFKPNSVKLSLTVPHSREAESLASSSGMEVEVVALESMDEYGSAGLESVAEKDQKDVFGD